MEYGFVRVAAAVPELRVADCKFNTAKIKELVSLAVKNGVQAVCFPELSITGYTCADLFFQKKLLDDSENALAEIISFSMDKDITILVGMPVRFNKQIFNVAVVIRKGDILGVVPKINLPNNNEFYEKRWFASGADIRNEQIILTGKSAAFSRQLIFETRDYSFAIEICEDLWMPIPPSSYLCVQGADFIFNLSASNELIAKNRYRENLILQQSARCYSGYIYSSAGNGESTTDVVYSGSAIIAENGKLLKEGERFNFESQLIFSELDVELLRNERMKNSNYHFDVHTPQAEKVTFDDNLSTQKFELSRQFLPHPFIPALTMRDESCEEIFSIQVGGLAKRWQHTRSENVIVGISGGLDSTLALLVCVKTADKLGYNRKKVIGVTMPGFGTTDRTYHNAVSLMQSLGITAQEISIKEAALQHFKDIGHNPDIHDVTYENVQARERTQILMDLSNKYNGFVVGTGDLSEMALGWSTYNGDHISMYAVNNGVPKTLVRYLVNWAATQLDSASKEILEDIIKTPVSPELLPPTKDGEILQKTEETVGPYELHDFFLYYFVRFGFSPKKIHFLACNAFIDKYDTETIEKWLRVFLKRFFAMQFKRSCIPDGPKVGSINLSPRGDWRMPSDAISFEL
ncbi:MAG: NAD(+) synthase [Paludibacteraceae bacterium]